MLELYQAEGCGYSARVRDALTDLGVSYVVHDPRTAAGEVRNQQTYGELMAVGDSDQLPFLVGHRRGVATYESDDIVAHLQEHYG